MRSGSAEGCATCVTELCVDEGDAQTTGWDLVATFVISIFVLRLAENYELPQPWAQRAMYWATYAVLAQVLLVIAV